jgi:uncharacterized membrane protein YedE/YeeE
MQNLFSTDLLSALMGGSLIGLAASFMLLSIGRMTGISGILYESIRSFKSPNHWRWSFLAGLMGGGVLLQVFAPTLLVNTLPTRAPILIAAGLLVGFGTRLSGGCTSGHGVCGVGRLSKRSIVATIVFVFAGMFVATLVRTVGLI